MKQQTPKPQRFLKPGLWFTGLSLDVEQVNPRMKLPCATCGQLPSEKRLRIRQGSGRSQQGAVLCTECAMPFVELLETELDRLQDYLLGTGIESVRLPGRNWPIKPRPKSLNSEG